MRGEQWYSGEGWKERFFWEFVWRCFFSRFSLLLSHLGSLCPHTPTCTPTRLFTIATLFCNIPLSVYALSLQAGAAAILLYIYILYGVALAKVWVENTYYLPPAWQWSLLGAVGTTVAFAIGAGIGLGSGMSTPSPQHRAKHDALSPKRDKLWVGSAMNFYRALRNCLEQDFSNPILYSDHLFFHLLI